ncbi:hypothetical protein FNF29_00693 [Cafeteria roenbergensis]|uniref:Uncharacterized protein n=1 Tax=Cafeteria roenbergensis TaxID=33653 RepID=A0A5A8CTW1_CAFRO|nr:hypothetical protein FNF29_00693 [Cafeteria roenbergensis]|eukprot:KAA0156582.1 hypothetical protein FNF29_00693 [Cafeteria roenbergensis]
MGCGASVSGPHGGLDLRPPERLRAGASTVKVVLAGNQGVGKSCLATRWVRDEFDEHNMPTMGSAFLTKSVTVSVPSVADPSVTDDTVLRIHLWDTAGEERYHAVAKSFFRGAKGAILVYDVTNPSSMEGIRAWARMVESEAPDAVKFLVGTKSDLVERAAVSEDDARAMASDITLGFTDSFRASALTGEGVHDVFETLAQLLAERMAS